MTRLLTLALLLAAPTLATAGTITPGGAWELICDYWAVEAHEFVPLVESTTAVVTVTAPDPLEVCREVRAVASRYAGAVLDGGITSDMDAWMTTALLDCAVKEREDHEAREARYALDAKNGVDTTPRTVERTIARVEHRCSCRWVWVPDPETPPGTPTTHATVPDAGPTWMLLALGLVAVVAWRRKAGA